MKATLTLTACALTLAVSVLHAQRGRGHVTGPAPKVNIVQSIGCAERRAGNPATWWLTRAAEATATESTFFNANEVEASRTLALGSNAYQLIGVADFLDKDGLLQEGQRSQFTTRDTANASGQLRAGHKVIVKGLLIDADGQRRINLTQVVSVSDTCQ